MLPDGRGLDTFTRAYAHSPRVPFVVLTGLADETVGLTAVRQGAQDYLIKGEVDDKLLLRAIRYATKRKKIQEEYGSFDAYQWRFVDGRPIRNAWKSIQEIPATTPVSVVTGCPPEKTERLMMLAALHRDTLPVLSDYAICMECRMR